MPSKGAYTSGTPTDGALSASLSSAILKRKRDTTSGSNEVLEKDSKDTTGWTQNTITAPVEPPSPSCSQRRTRLKIDIPSHEEVSSQDSEDDGLFTPSSSTSVGERDTRTAATLALPRATRAPPPIPGLYLFTPPQEDECDGSTWPIDSVFEEMLLQSLSTSYFQAGADQVMLFGTSSEGFPPILGELIRAVQTILESYDYQPATSDTAVTSPSRPTSSNSARNRTESGASHQGDNPRSEILDLIFPTHEHLKRQAIINFYLPGEGITSHVDLLGRYADGIVGVSLGSGCVMSFTKVAPSQCPEDGLGIIQDVTRRFDVYLPRRSVIVLSGPARYDWEHGIEERVEDWVDGEVVQRRERLSVTFRWMLEGADVVGGSEDM